MKQSILDTLGCAIGALSAGPMRRIREVVEEIGDANLCTLIGGEKLHRIVRHSPTAALFAI